MHKSTALLLVVCALICGAQVSTGGGADSASHVDLEDATLDVPELIAKYGYPVEVHDVTTSDGYILQMHRIPHGRDNNNEPSSEKPVVLVMHGLFSSSADYIIMGPKLGLGYILAEEGFDVWMGNARGNYYSKRHTSFNPESSSFWDFSWEQIGHEDLAAMVEHILSNTGCDAMHYIGHSQGTTVFFVLASLKPEYNAKFKTVHLMAPVAYLNHLNSPQLEELAGYANLLVTVGSFMGIDEVFARGEVFEFVNEEPRCIQGNLLSTYCEMFLEAFSAQNLDQFDKEMLPVIFGHTPAGSSLKQVAHFGQVLSNKRFSRWNFALALQNRLVYGTSPAPDYNLSAVTAQIKLHYSLADALSPQLDVVDLDKVLPNSQLRLVKLETFTHFDFVWGTEARDMVYNDIIQNMQHWNV